jgi:DNA replication protein DnaC
MIIEQTIDKLRKMKMATMAETLEEQMSNVKSQELSFEDRIGLIVDRQWDKIQSASLAKRLKDAKMKQNVSVESVDFNVKRDIDKAAFLQLAGCSYIHQHHNVIITGPTGVGKTYLACALGNAAIRQKLSVRYYRTTQIIADMSLARGDGSINSLIKRLKKVDLLILDDWGLYPIEHISARDIFEIVEERNGCGSTIISSQVPVSDWYDIIQAPTIADAILDRIIHNAFRIQLKGESMRKPFAKLTESE